jgi:hypothetical protein
LRVARAPREREVNRGASEGNEKCRPVQAEKADAHQVDEHDDVIEPTVEPHADERIEHDFASATAGGRRQIE